MVFVPLISSWSNAEKETSCRQIVDFNSEKNLQVVTQRELTNQITKLTLICKVSRYIVKFEANFSSFG